MTPAARPMIRRGAFGGLWLAAALVSTALPGSAGAQAPPHQPGDVCYTPYGWCFAQPPGPPGSPCNCPGPGGLVGGTRG